jgi:hypothetical protein
MTSSLAGRGPERPEVIWENEVQREEEKKKKKKKKKKEEEEEEFNKWRRNKQAALAIEIP